MKYLIASDIHGSLFYANALLGRLSLEGADRLILLGDLYYHGPRNPLPKDYGPAEVAKLFNGIKDKLIVVRGNCDSEVDGMISDFKFLPSLKLKLGGKQFYFTHGHKKNQKTPPCCGFDFLIYGHEHIGFIKQEGGKVYANPGSVSLPKDQRHSYMVLDKNSLVLKDLTGQTLEKLEI